MPTSAGTAPSELKPRVLVVDDEAGVRKLLANCLRRLNCHVAEADCGTTALRRLETEDFDLALIDVRMPGLDGLEVARRAKRLCPHLHVVIMTGYATIELAVRAVKEGGDDFLPKPFRIDQLRVILDKQLELLRDRLHTHPIANGTAETAPLPGLVGASPAMQEVYRTVRRVAPTDETVLIIGESGTGKELAARAIHFWSPRHKRRFVPVNCASMTDTILENELFGHEPQSFTGATGRKRGLIEKASGGTLFLDEIGDASPALQMALLRVLQEGEVRRVGGAEAIPVDLRVVAATNRQLEKAVREGRFRQDLFYRINVVPVEMPPLRKRPEDIPLLVEHFLSRLRKAGTMTAGVSAEAMELLRRHHWGGNVRELENVIERAAILSGGEEIRPEHLPLDLRSRQAAAEAAPPPAEDLTFREARSRFEKQYLQALLTRHGGSVAAAAKSAGMSRAHFYELIKKHGIELSRFSRR